MYTAYFYVDSKNGKAPVFDYINALPVPIQARFKALIEVFKQQGILPFPYASHIRGPLWEIRLREQRNRHRILYAIIEGIRIILLFAFLKRHNKTPLRAIEEAEHFLQNYYEHKTLMIINPL